MDTPTPPRTWQELETMATRIQAGQRAKGQKDFWGFVWKGKSLESLKLQRSGMAGFRGGWTDSSRITR